MTNNNANGMLAADNKVIASTCVLTGNSAGQSAGALYLDEENEVEFVDCVISSNSAGIVGGGAFSLGEQNILDLLSTHVSNNSAVIGGAVMSFSQNAIYIQSSTLSGNYASSMGGAIAVMDDSELQFMNGVSVLQDNIADHIGGAIALLGCRTWTMNNASLLVWSNKAVFGSAFFFKEHVLESSPPLSNLEVKGNSASGGGTLYWVYELGGMIEPPSGTEAASVVWSGNTAPYGTVAATQGVHLNSPVSYIVSTYGAPMSPPVVSKLFDYYWQPIPVSTATSSQVELYTDENGLASEFYCDGLRAYLSGSDLYKDGVTMSNSTFVFADLYAYCAPGGNMTVVFTAVISDLVGSASALATPYTAVNSTLLDFRACDQGEYIETGLCIECLYGSYSLVDYGVETCTSCYQVAGVLECYANQIVTLAGWWRRYDSNAAVLECPLGPTSCIGGNGSGNALCGLGYSGELCAVCADGYFLTEGACTMCEGDSLFSAGLILYIVLLVVVVVVGLSVYALMQILEKDLNDDEDEDAIGTSNEPEGRGSGMNATSAFILSWIDKLDVPIESTEGDPSSVSAKSKWAAFKDWAGTSFKKYTGQIKIIISTFQVVSRTSSNMDVQMPSAFINFSEGISVLNLNLFSVIPISCSGTYTFVDTMIVSTAMPIGVALVLFVIFVVSYSHERRLIQRNANRRRGDKAKKFQELQFLYLSYFFYLTYLVLPSVTTTLFQMFICTNVDPSGEDSAASDRYLTVDMSISCDSDYYYGGLSYAVIMILVYPVGIPCLYFWLLYSGKEEIKGRHTESSAAEESQEPSRGSQSNSQEHTHGRTQSTEHEETVNPMAASVASDAKPTGLATDVESADVRLSEEPDPDNVGNGNPNPNGLGGSIMTIEFLFGAYKPCYWYWEIVETTRRLILTAVLSVVGPGSSGQSVLAILLALFYIKIYGKFRPYGGAKDNFLAEVGQFQIYFTFFGAMIIQNNMLGDVWNDAVSYLLILLNLGVVGCILYFMWNDHIANQRSLDEKLRGAGDLGKEKGEQKHSEGGNRVVVASASASASTSSGHTEEGVELSDITGACTTGVKHSTE